jgi:membrane-bound ClpP family serine protease
MNGRLLVTSVVFIISAACLFPRPAMAYVGPGAGLSAIGAFIALIAGVVVAIFGFLWYPIKRLIRKRKEDRGGEGPRK